MNINTPKCIQCSTTWMIISNEKYEYPGSFRKVIFIYFRGSGTWINLFEIFSSIFVSFGWRFCLFI